MGPRKRAGAKGHVNESGVRVELLSGSQPKGSHLCAMAHSRRQLCFTGSTGWGRAGG